MTRSLRNGIASYNKSSLHDEKTSMVILEITEHKSFWITYFMRTATTELNRIHHIKNTTNLIEFTIQRIINRLVKAIIEDNLYY